MARNWSGYSIWMERRVADLPSEPNRMHRTVSHIVTGFLVLSTVLCFVVIFRTATVKPVSLFGLSLFYVRTGSMEPAIPTGSILVVRQGVRDIALGDIITFHSKDAAILGMPNTHRVIGQVGEGEKVLYKTQGDANQGPDPQPVGMEDIIGKVILIFGKTGALGLMLVFLGTRTGFFLLILVPLVLLTITLLRDFIRTYRIELARVAAAARQDGTGAEPQSKTPEEPRR